MFIVVRFYWERMIEYFRPSFKTINYLLNYGQKKIQYFCISVNFLFENQVYKH